MFLNLQPTHPVPADSATWGTPFCSPTGPCHRIGDTLYAPYHANFAGFYHPEGEPGRRLNPRGVDVLRALLLIADHLGLMRPERNRLYSV